MLLHLNKYFVFSPIKHKYCCKNQRVMLLHFKEYFIAV